jgi:RNA polymerase-binding transcription factor DksA
MAKLPDPVKGAGASKVKASTPPVAKKAAAKKATKQAATKQAATKKAAPKKAATKQVAAKKPAVAKKPAAKKSPFSATWLSRQEASLVEERAIYERQADSLQAEADALVADFESGDAQFDEDGGEGDTLSSERERDLALSAQARAAIEEIDHALGKFVVGTYGICEASGEPIPKERLEAIPWARVQVQYKTGGFGRP